MWGQSDREDIMDGRVLVGPTEAGEVLGCCARTFDRRLQAGRYGEVRFVRTPHGRLFVLEDVFRLAFPNATDEVIYNLAADHIARKMQSRAKERERKRRSARKKGGADHENRKKDRRPGPAAGKGEGYENRERKQIPEKL